MQTDEQRIALPTARSMSIETLVKVGIAYAAAGELTSAEEHFGRALKLEPNRLVLRENLAAIQIRRRKFEAAYDTLVFGFSNEDLPPDYIRQVALYCLAIDALDGATGLLQRYIALRPCDNEAKYFLADVLSRRGRLQEANLLVDNTLSGDRLYWPEAALQPLWTLGRYEVLEEALEQHADLQPDFLTAFNRGTVLLRSSRYQGALDHLNVAVSLAPGYAPARFNRGICHFLLNDIPTSISDWAEAARLDPQNTRYADHLRAMWLQSVGLDLVEAITLRAPVAPIIDRFASQRDQDHGHVFQAVNYFILIGLFEPARATCAWLSAREPIGQTHDQNFVLSTAHCLVAEQASVAQLEYEVAFYGHLDVRELSVIRSPLTEFLWRSQNELRAELQGIRRLLKLSSLGEDDCYNLFQADFRLGDYQAVITAANDFLGRSEAVSDRVLRALAFAEYASGGKLAAQHLLRRTKDYDHYRLGGYACAEELAVCSTPIMDDQRGSELLIIMDVWCSGHRTRVEQNLALPAPVLRRFNDVILLNDHGTLLAEGEKIVRETLNCDPGQYIYGWPGIIHSAGTRALIRCEPPQDRIPGHVVLAAHSRDQTSYAHWMLDVLPRILAATSEPALAGAPILVTKALRAWQKEALTLCGVDLTRVVHGDAYPLTLSDVTLPVMTQDLYPAPQSIRMLRTKLETRNCLSSCKPWRKLYVARHANFRRVLNAVEISDFLRRRGFEEISPGDLTVADQMKMFSEAKTVVAAGGAAVTNLLYMSPGTNAVVFGPATNYGTYFAYLASVLGIGYAGVVGPPTPDLANTYVGWNFSVSVSDIELALDAFESSSRESFA